MRRWGELHRRLAAQPVFAACSRQEIRFIARWGDEVPAEAGCVLWREDTIGLHFVVVESGELTLTRKGRRVGSLGPGGYAGDTAILSWAPQWATLHTTTACRLFVIGRAPLLSLVHMPGVRAGLLGVLDDAAARTHLRAIRAAGLSQWQRRVAPELDATVTRLPSSLQFYAPAKSPTVTFRPLRLEHEPPPAAVADAPTSRGVRAVAAFALALVVLVTAGVASETARPLVGLVSPAGPIDLSTNVTVVGAHTTPIHGRYILTAVRIRRPTYAQWIQARLRQQTTVPLAADQATAAHAEREAFADAKRNAAIAAESALTWDPAKLQVATRPLDVSGSSVGLIYALMIADLLDSADLARGRTIAATGQIDAEGRVSAVRFVAEKEQVARAAGATLFFVPPGETPRHASIRVVEVATLVDALEALRA